MRIVRTSCILLAVALPGAALAHHAKGSGHWERHSYAATGPREPLIREKSQWVPAGTDAAGHAHGHWIWAHHTGFGPRGSMGTETRKWVADAPVSTATAVMPRAAQ